MTDYSGFGVLGDIVTGGANRRAEASYGKHLGESVRGYSELDKARIVRAQANARDALPAAIAGDPVLGQRADLASAILGMATGQPNLNTYTSGLGDLGDMEIDRQITDALAAGDQRTARNLSAVKTDKVLPDLGAGGKVVFDPASGDVALTPLGGADVAATEALGAQRRASAGASNARAGLYDTQASVGGYNPNTGRRGGKTLTPAEADTKMNWILAQASQRAAKGEPEDVIEAWIANEALKAGITVEKPSFANVLSSVTSTLGDTAPAQSVSVAAATPPVPGAQQAPDGFWYVQQGGRWFRVD